MGVRRFQRICALRHRPLMSLGQGKSNGCEPGELGHYGSPLMSVR